MKLARYLAGVLTVCAHAAWSQVPAAAPAASGVQFANPAPNADNYSGDSIDYSVTVKTQATTLGATTAPRDVCLPAGTSLTGIGKSSLVTGGKTLQRSLFRVREFPEKADPACAEAERVKGGETVLFDPQFLRDVPPNRYGWTFGTLVVPYKYQFKGDRSLSGGATLGGYAGYRVTWRATSGIVAAFAGATKVDVPTLKDGQAVSESVAGLSYGLGLLASIKDEFKVGLVIGADRVDKKLGYVNNGKAWISFSLGYDFYQ